MSNYLISIPASMPKSGTIHDPDTKLKVNVVDAIKSTFTPRKGEVSYYVTAGDDTLAFETVGYNKHRNLLVLQMIARYCIYLGLFEAQIHSSFPYLNR